MARLALPLALACASYHVGVAEDTAALVQRSARVREEDPCECMRWEDAYNKSATEHVNCTNGHELDISRDTEEHNEHNPELIFEDCLFFWSQLKGNMCINTKWEQDPVQWCYVKKSCPGSHPSKHNGPFNMKYCTKTDKLSSDMPFTDAVAYTRGQPQSHTNQSAKLNLHWALPYFYPSWPEQVEKIDRTPEGLSWCLGKTFFLNAHEGHSWVLDCTGRTARELTKRRNLDMGEFTLCEIVENRDESIGYGQREEMFWVDWEHCIDLPSEEG